jgi:hypothetical protein
MSNVRAHVTNDRYAPPTAEVADPKLESFVVPTRVLRACQMFVASTLLGLVTLLPGAAAPAQEWSWLSFGTALVVLLLFGGLTIWLTVKIYRGRNWARWTMLIYLAPSWALGAMQFSEDFMRSPVMGIVILIATIVEVVACGLLFFGGGARWFASVAAARTNHAREP